MGYNGGVWDKGGYMTGSESGADSFRPGATGPGSGCQAFLKEVLSLRSKAIKVIARQVSDLKSIPTESEQQELLEHIELCISIASRLSRYANACIADPVAASDPEARRFVIEAALLLSQHEDGPQGS